MPLYEYDCEECGESFELLVRSPGQQGEVTCPKCGSARTRKAISLFGCSAKRGNAAAAAPSCGPAPT